MHPPVLHGSYIDQYDTGIAFKICPNAGIAFNASIYTNEPPRPNGLLTSIDLICLEIAFKFQLCLEIAFNASIVILISQTLSEIHTSS